MKNIRIFHLKIFIFLVVNFSVYLNRRVFVMKYFLSLCCKNVRNSFCIYMYTGNLPKQESNVV